MRRKPTSTRLLASKRWPGLSASGVVLPCLLSSFAACSSDDDGVTADTRLDSDVQRLRECGLLSSGTLNLPVSTTGIGKCRDDCRAAESCENVENFWCRRVTSASLRACLEACETTPFECDDGTMVEIDDVCEGTADCPDGSDERGCSFFECGSGERIAPRDQCDGSEHCQDGSDEQDCPTFTCGDGQQVLAADRCNLGAACSDFSDEVGCAQLVCPS